MQRVVHLAGHTHWSDVFEARAGSDGKTLQFERWLETRLSPCATPIAGKAALVTTQAATHAGIFFKPTGQGYGFAWLELTDGAVTVAFHGHDANGHAIRCPQDGLTASAPATGPAR